MRQQEALLLLKKTASSLQSCLVKLCNERKSLFSSSAIANDNDYCDDDDDDDDDDVDHSGSEMVPIAVTHQIAVEQIKLN